VKILIARVKLKENPMKKLLVLALLLMAVAALA